MYLTNGESNAVRRIYMDHPGCFPSVQDFEQAIERAVAEAPKGYRLLNKREFWEVLANRYDHLPLPVTMPGNPDFEMPGQAQPLGTNVVPEHA